MPEKKLIQWIMRLLAILPLVGISFDKGLEGVFSPMGVAAFVFLVLMAVLSVHIEDRNDDA